MTTSGELGGSGLDPLLGHMPIDYYGYSGWKW